ncbi:hypothetical protein TVAG_101360 [Trichomonas vaginalis G3]|uniref:Uncharacterized protein n=1 Tax=Trichomonas vaginalis (strain ATCC PRA-98 / G3) TaxID=412133 RepID=A2DJL8_TRIV3|nr:Major Facilitator Superfamily [Trichomonas vaginalis G3]EAY19418.1 hypothetical protein TVAG_101360 [Trichomonas vaginalis G3]KAI5493184.1 Major Facilitator Superfamily [Trichomonas vaginalis G3]|eukprot:XP_001580404.1 hypothetical protein [Trichomonas vaginalis G3]
MGNKFTKIALASVLFFFAFWSLTLTNIDYPLLTEYFGPTVSGSAVGIANFFLFIFVAIYQQISAAIIPLNGSQPTPSGVPKYEWQGYRNGLWLFGLVSCGVALIFALVAKDDNSECICKCKKQEKSLGPNLIDE